MSAPPELPFTFSGRDVWLSEFRLAPNHPRWSAAASTTDAAALIAFPRTTVGITHEGRREVVADPLSAVAYSPGQTYRRRLVTTVGDDCTLLAVTPEIAAEAARPFDARTLDPATYRFPFVVAPIARTAFVAVQELRHVVSRSAQLSADFVREELYGLVDHVTASGYGRHRPGTPAVRLATHRTHRDVVEGVRERIGRDLSSTETLDDVARAVFVSPFHLARIFRRITGQPIHAYRVELRLRASLPLIADGVRLSDVAQQLGFASHAHLTQQFKRAYGISPAQWRARLARWPSEMSKNVEAQPRRSLIA